MFTRVRGQQVSTTVVYKRTEESAFGDPVVRETTTSRKDFVITWAQPEEYVWNDPTTFTEEELKEAKQNREIHLAEVRARQENRESAFGTGTMTEAPKMSSKMEFDF